MDLKEFRQISNTNPIKKFSDDVEFSAACRQFYHSRRLAAEAVKEKLAVSGRQGKYRQTPVDTAIEKLRTQIAELMDQDLSLTRQLLTLNEAIEDLKWQKRHSYKTVLDSSCELSESDWSVSETDMYESGSDIVTVYPHRVPVLVTDDNTLDDTKNVTEHEREVLTSSEIVEEETTVIRRSTETTSDQLQTKPTSRPLSISIETRDYLELPTEFEQFLNGNSSICADQSSFDSGIHETLSWTDVNV